jgi:hypothetical protein
LKKDFYLEISLNKNTQKIIVGQPARGGASFAQLKAAAQALVLYRDDA